IGSLFGRASRLLLLLAEAENENFSNNSTGVFQHLFSPAPAPCAPTEASLEERFPVLEEAMNSTVPEIRRIARGACRAGLEADHFVRMIGPEHRGIEPTARLWHPVNVEEFHAHYRRVWSLLLDSFRRLAGAERRECAGVLIERGPSLVRALLAVD